MNLKGYFHKNEKYTVEWIENETQKWMIAYSERIAIAIQIK